MPDQLALTNLKLNELEANASPAGTDKMIVIDPNTHEPKLGLLSNLPSVNDAESLVDQSANDALLVTTGSTGTIGREITVANNSTSANPYFVASGSTADTNIGIDVKTKGTGIGHLIGDDTEVVGWQKDTVGKLGFFDKSTAPAIQAALVADASTTIAIAGSTAFSTGAPLAASSDVNAQLNAQSVIINAIKAVFVANGLMASST